MKFFLFMFVLQFFIMSSTINAPSFKASYLGIDIKVLMVSVEDGAYTVVLDKDSVNRAYETVNSYDVKTSYPEIFIPIV